MTDRRPTRRPRGTGGVRNRGTDRAPRWFSAYPAKLATFRLVLGDTVLLSGATEEKCRRLQSMRGGRIEVDGERRGQISKGPFRTKADAEKWLKAELRAKEEGRARVMRRITVNTLLTEWFDVRQHSLSPTTVGVYRGIIETRLRPALGSVRVDELTPGAIARLVDNLRRPGANRRGVARDQALSETSIQHVSTVLRTALQWAVKQRLIAYNPADDVDRPKRKATDMKIWTSDQLAQFLDHVRDDRLYPLWRLAAVTGMRRSEVLGLRWSDVDLDAATVSVARARVRVRSGMHEAARTKTGASRVVDLDPVTVAALKRWKAVQNEERLAWGAAYQTSGLVVTKEDGSGLHADHVQQRFGRLVKAAGVPTIRFHDLRHTHASLLLAAGTPVLDVSKRIGHASAAMTLNVYGHVVPGQGQKAAATFANLVDGAGGR